MLIMKTGDKAIADPKLTGLDTWVKGEVIDVLCVRAHDHQQQEQ